MQITFNRNYNSQYERPQSSYRVQRAVVTTGSWFAFGVGLDLVGRKCQVFKSPTKNSILINSIIASVAGLFSCFSKK